MGSIPPGSERSSHQTDWLSTRSVEDSLSFMAAVSALYKKSGPVSSSLDDLVQLGEYRAVVDANIPTDIGVEDYRGARQIQALFNKQCFVGLGYNPLHEGVKAFVKAEARCAQVNALYDAEVRPEGRAAVAIAIAREKLRQLFGQVPALESLCPRFGPGANTRVKMAQASLSGKLSAELACSADLFPTVDKFLSETPLLVQHHSIRDAGCLPLYTGDPDVSRHKVPVFVDRGKLVFVPKSAKTHRPIVVEPVLNGFWQLGVGSYLKGRLRAFGVDLTDQERNRKLARKGSEDGSLATLDLSSASDTLSWGLVADLVPPDWVDLLAQLRTGSVTYDGVPVQLEKFSSMGNGYTFELESSIFWALAFGSVTSVGGDVSNIGIYGDDIIVPTNACSLLMEVLDWCGFWVNPEKSFWSGPFRESCGADWLNGHDVRPFYIRDLISDQSLFVCHNWAMRRGEREFAKLAESWTWSHNRLYGPDGYGDGHLIGSYSLYSTRKSRRNGWTSSWSLSSGYFDTYSLRPKRSKKRGSGDWLLPTYTIYMAGGGDHLSHLTGSENPSDPYVTRGFDGYVRTPIYTHTLKVFNKV